MSKFCYCIKVPLKSDKSETANHCFRYNVPTVYACDIMIAIVVFSQSHQWVVYRDTSMTSRLYSSRQLGTF